MKKAFNSYDITKTIILSLFVLFFGIIYVVFIKIDDYDPSDLLETYIVETSNKHYKVNEYAGFGTYDADLNIINKSTNSNIVSIEMYVMGEDELNNDSEKLSDNIIIEESKVIRDNTNLININTSTAIELDALPKIGPSIANAIVKYREKYGDFKNIEQIKNVTGIGEKIFEAIKDLISV